MTYSNLKSSSLIGSLSLVLALSSLVACSEKNNPAVKNANNSTFYVDSVSASFTTVGEANAQGVQNKKILSMEACLKDVAQTNTINNVDFKLSAGDVSANKMTDHRGCVLWQELVEFDPQETEKNVFMTRSVQALKSHTGTEKIVFSVNPWKDQFSYNRQASVGGSGVNVGPVSYKAKDLSLSAGINYDYDLYVKISESGANGVLSPIKRQTEINTLRLKYKGIDYENLKVDQKLNLTFPFTYITDLSISFLRQSLGQISEEKIKMGNFMFHLVFLKEKQVVQNPQAEDVIAAVSFKGRPRGDAGMITVPITVEFNNIPALSSRMSVLLTVTSLDQPALFTEQTYEGMVNSVNANEELEIGLIPNDSNAHDLFEKYAALSILKSNKVMPTEAALTQMNAKEVKNTTVSFQRKSFLRKTEHTVDLLNVIENLQEQNELSFDQKSALCVAFFGEIQDKVGADYSVKNDYLNPCINSPSMLNAEIRKFVASSEVKAGKPTFSKEEVLTVTSSFVDEHSSTRASGYNYEFKVGNDEISLPLEILPINFSLGGKLYTSKSFERRQKNDKSVAISSTESLYVKPISVPLTLQASRCLLISLKTYWKNRLLADGFTAEPKFLCSNKTEKVETVEHYFLIDQVKLQNTNSVADKYSTIVNPLKMIVRGTASFDFLKSIVTSQEGYNVFTKVYSDNVLSDPSSFMTQEAPLMLSSKRKVLLSK